MITGDSYRDAIKNKDKHRAAIEDKDCAANLAKNLAEDLAKDLAEDLAKDLTTENYTNDSPIF